MFERRWLTVAVAPMFAALLLGACSGAEEDEPPAAQEPAEADEATPAEDDQSVEEEPAAEETSEADVELTPVKIALPEINSAFVNLLLAQHAGFFEDNGLDVELVVLASPTIASALVAGDVDLTAGAGSSTRAALADIPVTVVVATMAGSDYTITADVSIETPEDLRGESVVTGPPTSTPGVMAAAILDKYGVLEEVEMVNVAETSARTGVLQSRQTAGGLMNLDRALRMVEEDDQLHVLIPPDEFPQLPFTGLATSDTFLAENPDVVEAAIRASLEAGVMLRDDPEGAAAVIAEVLELAPEQADEVVSLMAPLVIIDGIPDEELLASEAELDSLSQGEEVTVEEISSTYDLSIVERVAAEMGLS